MASASGKASASEKAPRQRGRGGLGPGGSILQEHSHSVTSRVTKVPGEVKLLDFAMCQVTARLLPWSDGRVTANYGAPGRTGVEFGSTMSKLAAAPRLADGVIGGTLLSKREGERGADQVEKVLTEGRNSGGLRHAKDGAVERCSRSLHHLQVAEGEILARTPALRGGRKVVGGNMIGEVEKQHRLGSFERALSAVSRACDQFKWTMHHRAQPVAKS
ncbi:hypothetical protein B0H14DRAFT_3127846 [Mycena olivaceomarginata]|nr:hypothetical protein B0H14DRAFT_3127846 [Mycena olivaceomarginata]